MVYKIFCLSRRSNGFGVEIEYQVVKDFCKNYYIKHSANCIAFNYILTSAGITA